jgi:hypothetical protein
VSERSDDHFEVNVDELRTNANTHLGASIQYLQDTVSHVRRTEDDDGAFEGGDGLFSEIAGAWGNTRLTINEVLDHNIETLELDKEALVEVADRYDAVDLNSATALNRIAEEAWQS